MKKKKKEREYWKRRFGNLTAADMEPYYHHLDLRRFWELDDEGLAYLLTNVKGVDMLDFNEAEITNEGIRTLTKLEYVKELRLKDCRHLDNGCIESLNKLSSLVFLRLKNTKVTIDGLLQLNNLPELKTLMFTSEVEIPEEKMRRLRAILPACEFVVNGQTYGFADNEWDKMV